ncbi:MAG: peroxiredoxin [Lysobacterales bacterium]|jgi:peroxiredoxin
MMIAVNDTAPDFSLGSDSGEMFRLQDHAGDRLLLVFYPGDNTPVCTRQLCEYRDEIGAFTGLGVTVVGISADDPESHRAFKNRYDLPFVLLSDPRLEVAQRYGCKGVFGMKRGLFLIDDRGIVRYAHVEPLALFRRRAEELLGVIRGLDPGRDDEAER